MQLSLTTEKFTDAASKQKKMKNKEKKKVQVMLKR